MENPFVRIPGINLAVLLGFWALVLAISGQDDAGISIFFLSLFQAVINLILAIIFFATKRPQMGLGAVLALFLVLIIGFSVCVATVEFNLH